MYGLCDFCGLLKGIKKKKKNYYKFLSCVVLMRLPDYNRMNQALYKYLIKFT